MKKLYSLLTAVCLIATAQAQTTVIDTVEIDIYGSRATGATLSSTGHGYVFGTGYYDLAGDGNLVRLSNKLGQHFDSIGTASISEVLVGFGTKTVSGTPDDIIVGIYNAGADSMPTTVIGSTNFSVDSIVPNGAGGSPIFTSIPFTTQPSVTSDFVVVFDYTAVNDTFGILNSNDGDGNAEQRTRMFLSPTFGGMWQRLGQVLSASTDVDLFVVPVALFTSIVNGAPQPIATKDFSVSLFPVPANDNVTLSFDMNTPSEVTVNVFDLSGKSYFESTEIFHAGTNTVSINVKDLPAGNYYVTSRTATSSCTGKFTVAK